jgi:hypothetical protein
MRIVAAILAVFLTMASTAHAGARPHPGAERGGPPPSNLPETLNASYPPAAGQPVYLLRMLELETSFSGIIVDLMEDDIQGARSSFDGFAGKYRELAGIVPEWRSKYPAEPVKELGEALASGDRKRAMSAFANVGGICHRCHVETMVPVQQKYHWGDFGTIVVKDPLSGAATDYAKFKEYLAANLAGITVDLREGEVADAQRQFQAFRARFQSLAESCNGCHEEKSRYYVDREVQEIVDEIGKAFTSRTVAADQIVALTARIGKESCFKCHLVHLPAAFAGTAGR